MTAANSQVDSVLVEKDELLRQMINKDWLTHIANRGAAERAIKDRLEEGGAFFICDVDAFKEINDRFGHLTGDECLKTTARLLTYIMRSCDIVGRLGGDEFLIFTPGPQTDASVKSIKAKIRNRFDSYNEHAGVPIHVSIGAAIFREGDSYESLFSRADADLYLDKKKKHVRSMKGFHPLASWNNDMEQIQKDLTEEIQAPGGAYCQSFESFRVIFRHLERCMRRSDQKACVVLLSLTTEEKRSVDPAELMRRMKLLDHVISTGLRLGDVYTQYSSSQYLVLLTDVTLSLSELVSTRIRDSYYRELGSDHAGLMLLFYSYQLEAAKILIDK